MDAESTLITLITKLTPGTPPQVGTTLLPVYGWPGYRFYLIHCSALVALSTSIVCSSEISRSDFSAVLSMLPQLSFGSEMPTRSRGRVRT